MISWQSISRIGGRLVNEDCTGVHQVDERYGFFLADGLGGHGGGEIASQTAVKQAILQFEAVDCNLSTVERIFEAGQQALLQIQREQHMFHGMKTTMTALLLDAHSVCIGHIGDSRVYYFQDEQLIGRTKDHSVPQMLLLAGEIREDEIRHHPDRNRLLRALGVPWEEPQYQLAKPIVRKGRQAFLLCSDGFWELVNEQEMTDTLKRAHDVTEWLVQMERLVLLHGAETTMDNYSAVAVWATQTE